MIHHAVSRVTLLDNFTWLAGWRALKVQKSPLDFIALRVVCNNISNVQPPQRHQQHKNSATIQKRSQSRVKFSLKFACKMRSLRGTHTATELQRMFIPACEFDVTSVQILSLGFVVAGPLLHLRRNQLWNGVVPGVYNRINVRGVQIASLGFVVAGLLPYLLGFFGHLIMCAPC